MNRLFKTHLDLSRTVLVGTRLSKMHISTKCYFACPVYLLFRFFLFCEVENFFKVNTNVTIRVTVIFATYGDIRVEGRVTTVCNHT